MNQSAVLETKCRVLDFRLKNETIYYIMEAPAALFHLQPNGHTVLSKRNTQAIHVSGKGINKKKRSFKRVTIVMAIIKCDTIQCLWFLLILLITKALTSSRGLGYLIYNLLEGRGSNERWHITKLMIL